MANFYSDNKDLKFHLTHPLMKKIVSLKEEDFAEKCVYDYCPLDYEDAIDSYDKVLDLVGSISGDTIANNAKSVDEEGPVIENNHVVYAKGTQENFDEVVQAGLYGMTLPRKYDGLNFPIVPYCMAAEMVSRADASFVNIWGLQDCAETIHEFGSDELKDEFLPRINKGATASMDLTEPDAGSDLQAIQLKATWDEGRKTWLLNGVKRFITNGDSDISLVMARSEEGTTDARGISLFIYDRQDGGFTVRRIEHKMGIKGSPTCELVFKDAPAKLLGDRKMGLIKYVMSLMNSARLGIGAQSVGIAEAALREAEKYASERLQFGKPIIQFPAVYEILTNMKVKTQAMRTLLYETARFVDIYKAYSFISNKRKLEPEERNEFKKYQKLADAYTPLLKLFSSEGCNRLAYDAIQVHGGTGFMHDFPVERIYRDARITSIYEGTSQLQVVAAIRGVTTGAFLSHIKDEYEKTVNKPEFDYLKRILMDMTAEYEQALNKVHSVNDNEFLDFHARRLVEMIGNIVIGYLLILDAMRDPEYKNSAELFIKTGKSENKDKLDYIMSSELKDLGLYKH
ncbi:MAG: acyl-CoA dehydrogenase family protein [Bacteroidota bacterium]|nr:acyl-CoA dehydrogenase family protein [Bacteroidota bacterium]